MQTGGEKEEQKVAVAIIHGMGRQKEDFAAQLQERLEYQIARGFRKRRRVPRYKAFEFVPIYWAPIADQMQYGLEGKIRLNALAWRRLRSFVIGYLGDAIAYQPPLLRNEFLVDSIHREIKLKLQQLAGLCGEHAPLCVISHSLGTVIGSEYFKSVQQIRDDSGISPLAVGRTVALYYTMGSPIPIWALREKDYGSPPDVPSSVLQQWYPDLVGEWVNFYSKYDVLSFPLRGMNDSYRRKVSHDRHVAVGRMISRCTPLSHNYYWENKQIVKWMADGLVRTWMAANPVK